MKAFIKVNVLRPNDKTKILKIAGAVKGQPYVWRQVPWYCILLLIFTQFSMNHVNTKNWTRLLSKIFYDAPRARMKSILIMKHN